MDDADLIIVGGGIAGGSLATVMAREGARVLVLERQRRFRDQVRGEIIWPWGVRVARRLGIESVLLDAGAVVARWLASYDEGSDGLTQDDGAAVIPGIDGSINLTHPRACASLIDAAAHAGAVVHLGVRDVEVTVGPRPSVRWVTHDGEALAARAHVVAGADGRHSIVRSQAGIPLEVDPPAHLVAGMLVAAVDGMDRHSNLVARESDLLFFAFPEDADQARLYLFFPTGQRSRFSGRDGARRFLSACSLRCVEGVADWQCATAAGPCATFLGQDSRALTPLAEGVVLLGDAAGYENPVNGQGLSMTLQDVHDVSRALLGDSARARALEEYAAARASRQRLANLAVELEVWANDGFAVQDPARRAARYRRIRSDGVLTALENTFWEGFESVPAGLTAADVVALRGGDP